VRTLRFDRMSLSAVCAAALAVAFTVVGCASYRPAATPGSAVPSVGGGDGAASEWRYVLIIDASSSASTLEVYQWQPRGIGQLPRIEPAPFPVPANGKAWEHRVRPGLSAYANRPRDAARSLEELVDYALDKIGNDPEVRAATTLSLRATAGMRLLPEDQQEEILAAVENYFSSLPFGSTSARIIDGTEEGVYGWIAVNYLLGHLEHGGAFPTVGALDLGGASTQITFVPLDYPRRHAQPVTIGDNTYHLYSVSYLGLGQDESRERIASPECFLAGYPLADGSAGTGDFDACRGEIREAVSSACENGPCSLFGTYQPPLYGDFLAFSVYAYASEFFDLREQLIPERIAEQGRDFCARSWDEVLAADPGAAENPFLPNYCYTAAHVTTLLTDGFGFSPTSDRITAPLRVQGKKVGWALGSVVYDLAGRTD
jgi:Golgi nucleoside diphosphatase